MRWRALPIATVLAIAAVMFWGLVTVFGSSGSEEVQLPLVTDTDARNLPRIPLAFPEVSKPMIEALPAPEPSPEPPAVTPAAKKPTTTKPRAVKVPTDGATGSAVTGESGNATVGPNTSTPASSDDSDNPVGDLNDDFENPSTFGPDQPKEEPEPSPEPPDEPEVDNDEPDGSSGVNSGNTGNNGADGSSESKTDPGDSENGND